MKPTKYELLEERGILYLRGYAKETAKGYFNVEACRKVTGESLAGLRIQGAKIAKRMGVKFEDKTSAS